MEAPPTLGEAAEGERNGVAIAGKTLVLINTASPERRWIRR